METFKLAVGGDRTALAELPKYKELGISEEYVKQAMEGDPQGEQAQAPPAIAKATQEQLKRQEQDYWKRQADTVKEKVATAIDNDEVLGAIMSREGLPAGFRDRVAEMSRQVLTRRYQDAEASKLTWEATPRELKAIVQEVRGMFTDLGLVPAEGESWTGSDHPSAGRSPGGLPSGIHLSKKPLERPSSREAAAHGEYALQRMLQLRQEGD